MILPLPLPISLDNSWGRQPYTSKSDFLLLGGNIGSQETAIDE
jgi:hypothetical protein